jgi:hypothetical protein
VELIVGNQADANHIPDACAIRGDVAKDRTVANSSELTTDRKACKSNG